MTSATHRWSARLRQLFAQSTDLSARVPHVLTNATSGNVLASCLNIATTSAERSKGLLGMDSLPPGGGLWISPCESVHTFWMRFPIDLVYVDRTLRVKKVRSSVGPWRVSACLSAHSVIELPSGVVHRTGTQRGDQLEISATDPLS